jgi:hypothetical protein
MGGWVIFDLLLGVGHWSYVASTGNRWGVIGTILIMTFFEGSRD